MQFPLIPKSEINGTYSFDGENLYHKLYAESRNEIITELMKAFNQEEDMILSRQKVSRLKKCRHLVGYKKNK